MNGRTIGPVGGGGGASLSETLYGSGFAGDLVVGAGFLSTGATNGRNITCSGGLVSLEAYWIRCSGTLTLSGGAEIRAAWSGASIDAAGAAGGTDQASGWYKKTRTTYTNGGTGVGAAGNSAFSVAFAASGAGGAGGSGAGGAAAAAALTARPQWMALIESPLSWLPATQGIVNLDGFGGMPDRIGASGGTGAGDGVNSGGGAGAAGGIVVIAAPTITGAGRITARGGNGGTPPAGNCGGGGGGSGGYVLIITDGPIGAGVTIDANGGAGGAGVGTGVAGAAGGAGVVRVFRTDTGELIKWQN